MKHRVILFGSTGMIGQAVLQECISDERVEHVLAIVRTPSGIRHPKVREIVHEDLYSPEPLRTELAGYDSCLFCIGVTSVGLPEEAYRKVTYTLTVGIAELVKAANPHIAFCYISGSGTNAAGRSMWARVKGELENRLISMFDRAYMLRPGYIQPMKGIRSRTGWYNVMYMLMKPFYFLLRPVKAFVTDSVTLGKAMLRVAISGYSKNILESADINRIGRTEQPQS